MQTIQVKFANYITSMKLPVSLFLTLCGGCILYFLIITGTGCANIIPPTGGPRDSIPPVLIEATPPDSAINYKGNRITLTFNEYVALENALENVLVSPVPNNNPVVDFKLRNVTVKLRDTLEPNTTYSINFGDAIKDVNEGNIYKNFIYVFSTGPDIDQNILAGRVTLAAEGKYDSTLIAVLYKNPDDSAIAKEKPRFIARVNGKGFFMFNNLPSGKYNLFAIPNSFQLRYDDTTRPFAFAPQPIELDSNLQDVQLYAYTIPKEATSRPAATANKDKNLRFSSNAQGGQFDFLDTLSLTFNKPITSYDSSKVALLNKDYEPFADVKVLLDTTNQSRFIVAHKWLAATKYFLIFQKETFADSTGITLSKTDTIGFTTKSNEDYGSLKIRFNNLDTSQNPVLQLLENNVVAIQSPITQRDWTRKLVKPGTYEVRILYDANKNGQWDRGNYFGIRRQPEVVNDLGISIDIRANWDNEKEIVLIKK